MQSLYGINLKDPIECMFYSNFFSKIERAVMEFPKELQENLKQSILYKIIAFNFQTEAPM